ncbi:MAG: ATP-dependent DNA helicase RecG [Gammaproteobacteria bacterium]|nr:ATP-dependent DNA helicase RecG [Gammaproteobacteria bacterium]
MGRRANPGTPAPALAASGEASVRELPGVGPALAEKLAARGLIKVQDLWLHLPTRYEDRTTLTPIRELVPGQPAQVEGRVEAVERGFRYRPLLRVTISDDSRATLALRFFHFNSAQAAQFIPGRRLRCYGEARPSGHGLEIVHPSYRFLAESDDGLMRDSLDPVYPVIEGVGPQTMSRLIAEALKRLPPAEELELLPVAVIRALDMPTLKEALLVAHRPPPDTDVLLFSSGRHPALQRLAFEEMLAHHLSLRRQRIALRAHGASAIKGRGALADALRKALPYSLTGAQRRVYDEVAADMRKPEPMLRLVQGDVGSGKTVVAALAALRAVEAGKQVALMAPTELLAEQHLLNFRNWLEPLGIEVAWLAGKVTGKARTAALSRIASGAGQVVVGTHALMQEGVVFKDLALAIVDEQHRFGVHQRLSLRDKGLDGSRVPHQLVMTATPIPRTLAMSAYADLDVSVIDEMPPGRTPVTTVALPGTRRDEVVDRIRLACSVGRQVYWVCTLIDESEAGDGPGQGVRIEAQAAQTTYDALTLALPGLRVGLLHGRMKPAEKQSVMASFKAGDIQLLVATTVIEVGVDVPNASLMVIENAERLGLAQLHQLRGRVGRGAEASSCVLMYKAPLSMLARQRLEVMRQTTDGFVIAEKDLELRGPGELLGTRQTGLAGFRVADLVRDAHLLPAVQQVAETLLTGAPELAGRVVARWIGSAVRFAGA